MVQTKAAVPVQELPPAVRDAIDMYVPYRISATSAHYYIQAEHVRLLRGRAQAERNAFRWERTVAELQKALPDLSVKDATDYVSDNCYGVDVLLHPGYELSGDPASLLGSMKKGVRIASIHASFLAPAWWMGVRKVTRNGSGVRTEWEWPQLSPAQRVRLVVDEVLGTMGWLRLSNEQVRQRIAQVELKYLPQGEARVGHVLFSESIDFP